MMCSSRGSLPSPALRAAPLRAALHCRLHFEQLRAAERDRLLAKFARALPTLEQLLGLDYDDAGGTAEGSSAADGMACARKQVQAEHSVRPLGVRPTYGVCWES